MVLAFTGRLDRGCLVRACEQVRVLVADPEVARRWTDPSALPGLSVGGLVRHLVSQPECAVEFLGLAPPDLPALDVMGFFADADWWLADVAAPANTSIRDDVDAMASVGPAACVRLLDDGVAALPDAVDASPGRVHVPWQDCVLDLDDFLVCRALEVVVHADDLAASLDRPTPAFDDATLAPVAELLTALSMRRHGGARVVRTLSRSERADDVSAFGGSGTGPG